MVGFSLTVCDVGIAYMYKFAMFRPWFVPGLVTDLPYACYKGSDIVVYGQKKDTRHQIYSLLHLNGNTGTLISFTLTRMQNLSMYRELCTFVRL